MPEIPRANIRGPLPQGGRIRIPAETQVGESLKRLGDTILRTAGALSDIEQRKEELRQTNETASLLNSAKNALEIELGNARQESATSDSFKENATRRLTAIVEKVRDLASQRGILDVIAPKLESLIGDSIVKIEHEKDKIFVDEQKGLFEEGLLGLERAAIEAPVIFPFETPVFQQGEPQTDFQKALGAINSFIDSQAGLVITNEEAARRKRLSIKRVVSAKFRSLAMADPEGTLRALAEKENLPFDIEAEEVNALMRFAEAQLKRQEAEREREARRQDVLTKRSQEELEAEITREILFGKDIVDKLADPVVSRLLGGERVRTLFHFQESVRNKAQLDISDKGTLFRLRVAAVTGRDPITDRPVTTEDVMTAVVEGRLNLKDAGDLLIKFAETKDARRREGETLFDQKVTRGAALIKQALSLQGDLFISFGGGGKDPTENLLLYEALLEFYTRAAQDRTRDPLDLADEIATRALRGRAQSMQLEIGSLIKGLQIQSKQDVIDKFKKKEITRERADALLRLFEFLEIREKETAQQLPPPKPAPEDRGILDFFKDLFTGGERKVPRK